MEKEILKNLNKYLTPEEVEINNDFLKLYWYCKLKYVRNFYRWNYTFRSKKYIRTNVNYREADENDTAKTFLLIQSKVNSFRKILKKGEWTYNNTCNYKIFINKTIYTLTMDVMSPLGSIFPDYEQIIQKYRDKHDAKLQSNPVRSSKINYEVFDKIMSGEHMFEPIRTVE